MRVVFGNRGRSVWFYAEKCDRSFKYGIRTTTLSLMIDRVAANPVVLVFPELWGCTTDPSIRQILVRPGYYPTAVCDSAEGAVAHSRMRKRVRTGYRNTFPRPSACVVRFGALSPAGCL